MREKLKAGNEYVNHDLVTCTCQGTVLSPRNLLRTFKGLIQKSNVPDIRFHDLRHTHATSLLLEGINPKIVAERLGHSKVSVTLDTYSHVLPNMQKEAAEKQNKTKLYSADARCNNGIYYHQLVAKFVATQPAVLNFNKFKTR